MLNQQNYDIILKNRGVFINMKKNLKKLLMLSLLILPKIVLASSSDDELPIFIAIFMEAFVSIHMSVFVLKPLSQMFAKENSNKLFWTLFAIRAGILLFFDIFVTTYIAMVDFFAVFIGAFLIVPISALLTKTQINHRSNQVISTMTVRTPIPQNQIKGIELKCSKCNSVLKISDKFCGNCGAPFDGNNVVVSANTNSTVAIPPKVAVLPTHFDSMYSMSEDKMLEEFINRELLKNNIDKSSKLIPSEILKRKNILNIIFSILIFVYVSLIFFHFPLVTYVIGLIILIIFFKVSRNYNLIKYLKKELKARPNEKITNIVMNVKNTFVTDNSKLPLILGLIVAFILPLIIFINPRIIYEKVDDGYAVRYYTFGLTNFETVTIPETYKDEKIVSLRGNTFSNMPFLKSVKLPDTITEIRGQAFMNCTNLTTVNIPKNLEYLGGGAFKNAKSIKTIELPDTLTHLGGESFYEASSLEYIKLSENLTEIRGDSFSYCTSLRSIVIPDKVTRIGGHAFYGNTLLSEVTISPNSQLTEIGSSAFRQCYSLREINIPANTHVNERAFKESPTVVNRYEPIISYNK